VTFKQGQNNSQLQNRLAPQQHLCKINPTDTAVHASYVISETQQKIKTPCDDRVTKQCLEGVENAASLDKRIVLFKLGYQDLPLEEKFRISQTTVSDLRSINQEV
jgi:hypothetical protein